jgi:hypothetical protein
VLLALVLAAAPPLDWQGLVPGVEYRTFVLEAKPASGDGLLHVVRIDASVASLDFGLASQHDGTLRTAREWCDDKGFSVVINAGMYATDYVANVGYLRRGAHLNNGTWNSKYQSVLALGPKQQGLPAAQLWDRERTPDAQAAKYESVVQNLRLLKAPGQVVWKPNGEAWSEAAIRVDRSGRVLFLFSATPFEMATWGSKVLELPLDVVRAMHVEGGPEASLSIHTKAVQLDLAGGPRRVPFGAAGLKQWRIPNVVGVRAR